MSLLQFARFLRTDTLGASVTMVLLGAATASSKLTPAMVPGLVAVAVSFHVYAYVLNDVVDLPIDRTDPRRRNSPLVAGQISTAAALAFALVQIPVLALLIVLIGGGFSAFVALGVLVAAVTIYDLWGKRSPMPPMTDLVQGVAWGALGWLAAEFTGGAGRWTVVLALYFLAFIMLANGVHGSIRDLANDSRHGARTTATWFAAVSDGSGAVKVEGRYLGYAMTLQIVTVTLAFIPTALAWAPGRSLQVVLMAVGGAASTILLVAAARAGDRHRQLVLGAWHLILILASVFLMVADRLPPWALFAAMFCYLAPFASYRWLFRPKPADGTHWTVESAQAR